ncbi:unnamed protein product [Aphanomyces euteiches]|uniref:Uncharacterized protein n=1 Tax=Aphanomyces euteiches TaxID=100861 RepID=A0A6G0XR94_9STRA|nr:hypothetical protein Ae201684_002248 [Aphanomyces euteiches]KAH9087478.1 hypothetical protein Ae201684P_000885 [Aphanomyces euteiches]KAH9142640.1 hypothetical protein AeRB84_013287 [Aphanomyces euteiches]
MFPSSFASPRTTTSFVFGWNNFLCPSTWLQQTYTMHPNQLAHVQLRQTLAAIDMAIVTVLSQARSAGPVYVVCDDDESYMEQICGAFFPACGQLFAQSDITLVPHTRQALNAICAPYRPTSLAVFGVGTLRDNCVSLLPAQPSMHKFVSVATAMPSTAQVWQYLTAMGQGLLSNVSRHHAALDIVM